LNPDPDERHRPFEAREQQTMQRSTITRRWAAALCAGAAFGTLLAPGPAHAASSFDGEWTGTGEAPVCQNVGGGAGALASYKGAPVIVVTDGALEGSFGTLKLSGKVAPNGAVSGLGSAGDACSS
jgi:hypothetical protein